MKEEALSKIEAEMRICSEKRVPAQPIAQFLSGKCREDDKFAALVVQEHKTLEKCFGFVFEQVQNHLNRDSGWIDDHEVFQMAEDYFNLDDAESERQKAEEIKRREAERQARELESRQKAAAAKEQKAREISWQETGKQVLADQLSLF